MREDDTSLLTTGRDTSCRDPRLEWGVDTGDLLPQERRVLPVLPGAVPDHWTPCTVGVPYRIETSENTCNRPELGPTWFFFLWRGKTDRVLPKDLLRQVTRGVEIMYGRIPKNRPYVLRGSRVSPLTCPWTALRMDRRHSWESTEHSFMVHLPTLKSISFLV